MSTFLQQVELIAQERARQDAKWGSQRRLAPEKWAVILGEEVGEVHRAVCEHDFKNLQDELVQVAAVCVAWLEAIHEHGANT